MEFDDLVRVWREQDTGDVRRTRIESLSELRGRATRTEANSRKGFRRAAIIWLVMVPLFTFGAVQGFLTGNPDRRHRLHHVGRGLRGTHRLSRPRHELPEPEPTLPVRAAVEQEIQRLRIVGRAIRRMIDWVVGSLAVGGSLVALALNAPLNGIVMSLVFILIALAARKAWRRLAARAQAAGSELESWIADLERV